MTPFFITGLPRSGTAWLANLFSPGKALCFHEPANGLASLQEAGPGRRVGISDAALVRAYANVVKGYPQARWLYVTRPMEEVFSSLVSFLQASGEAADENLLRAELATDAALGLHLLHDSGRVAGVAFSDITSDAGVAKAAWNWLLPEIRFDEQRWKILSRLNVQQNLKHALKERGQAQPENVITPAFTLPANPITPH